MQKPKELKCPLCHSVKLTRYDASGKSYELITCQCCKMIWKRLLTGNWIDTVTDEIRGDVILEMP